MFGQVSHVKVDELVEAVGEEAVVDFMYIMACGIEVCDSYSAPF